VAGVAVAKADEPDEDRARSTVVHQPDIQSDRFLFVTSRRHMSTPNPSFGSKPAVPANRRVPIHHIKPEEAAAAKRAEEDPDVTAYSYEGHGARRSRRAPRGRPPRWSGAWGSPGTPPST
jgi:hypothetical protein